MAHGDLAAARSALVAVLTAEAPDDLAPEDRRVVLQDLCFRLAEIEIESGLLTAAVEWSDRGLELGRRNDIFEANLLVVQEDERLV